MFQSKVSKCAILLGILLVLFISPSLASGALLEPEDNAVVKCDFFIEHVTVSNQPGWVRVNLTVYNMAAEGTTRQLKLRIASFTKNYQEIIIMPRDFSYENGIEFRHNKSDPYTDNHSYPNTVEKLEFYRHEFILTFDPPLSEKTRTFDISYITNGAKWDNDKHNMLLYVEIWSPKITIRERAYVYVQGEGEGFKIGRVWRPWDNWLLQNDFKELKVTIDPLLLVSEKYDRRIYARFEPAYPSQWHVWDQYQKAEESLRLSTASVILAIFAIAASVITTLYAVKKTRALTWELEKIMKKMKLENLKKSSSAKSSSADNILSKKVKELDKKIEVGKVDNLLLFASSLIGLLFVLIQYILADAAFMLFLPLLVIGLIIPVNIGYFKGALKNSTIHSIKGWIHFLIGLGNYIWFVILMVLIVRLDFKNDLLIPVSIVIFSAIFVLSRRLVDRISSWYGYKLKPKDKLTVFPPMFATISYLAGSLLLYGAVILTPFFQVIPLETTIVISILLILSIAAYVVPTLSGVYRD